MSTETPAAVRPVASGAALVLALHLLISDIQILPETDTCPDSILESQLPHQRYKARLRTERIEDTVVFEPSHPL